MPRDGTYRLGQLGPSSGDARPWSVTPEKLAEVVRRVVAVARPLRVILFGSAARGELTSDSDIDLLVVTREEVVSQVAEAGRIYQALQGTMVPVDLLLISDSRLAAMASDPGYLYGQALREGVVVYHA
jgi:predicted nucleotidyltransferase